jgi:hypothetical protein
MEVMETCNSWQKNILYLIPKRKEYANENEKVSDSDNELRQSSLRQSG